MGECSNPRGEPVAKSAARHVHEMGLHHGLRYRVHPRQYQGHCAAHRVRRISRTDDSIRRRTIHAPKRHAVLPGAAQAPRTGNDSTSHGSGPGAPRRRRCRHQDFPRRVGVTRKARADAGRVGESGRRCGSRPRQTPSPRCSFSAATAIRRNCWPSWIHSLRPALRSCSARTWAF